MQTHWARNNRSQCCSDPSTNTVETVTTLNIFNRFVNRQLQADPWAIFDDPIMDIQNFSKRGKTCSAQ